MQRTVSFSRPLSAVMSGSKPLAGVRPMRVDQRCEPATDCIEAMSMNKAMWIGISKGLFALLPRECRAARSGHVAQEWRGVGPSGVLWGNDCGKGGKMQADAQRLRGGRH